jgi:hypothetical protein
LFSYSILGEVKSFYKPRKFVLKQMITGLVKRASKPEAGENKGPAHMDTTG